MNVITRNAIWESICGKVDAVSDTRTTHELKKGWQDFMRKKSINWHALYCVIESGESTQVEINEGKETLY